MIEQYIRTSSLCVKPWDILGKRATNLNYKVCVIETGCNRRLDIQLRVHPKVATWESQSDQVCQGICKDSGGFSRLTLSNSQCRLVEFAWKCCWRLRRSARVLRQSEHSTKTQGGWGGLAVSVEACSMKPVCIGLPCFWQGWATSQVIFVQSCLRAFLISPPSQKVHVTLYTGWVMDLQQTRGRRFTDVHVQDGHASDTWEPEKSLNIHVYYI